MTRYLLLMSLALLLAFSDGLASPRVNMETNFGTITLELDREKAPKTVENFVKYAQDGFYNGTIFHRVIDNFMIQAGGYTEAFQRKPTRSSIDNEAANGLKNTRGSVAMARTADPHSATSQFFINVKDNKFLDHKAPNGQGWGYAVFGTVVAGMDVVDKIRQVPTGPAGPFPKDVPQTPVIIEKVTVIAADSDTNEK